VSKKTLEIRTRNKLGSNK